VLILALTVLSKILGLGRETAIAYSFGATGITDAFLVAFIIPYMFYGVVGMALATVIVPIFAGYAAEGRRGEAWRVMSLVVNGVVIVMATLTLAGMVAAPLVADLLGPDLPPETQRLAAKLTAIMMPSVIFMSLAGVLGRYSQCLQHLRTARFRPGDDEFSGYRGRPRRGEVAWDIRSGLRCGAGVFGLCPGTGTGAAGCRLQVLLLLAAQTPGSAAGGIAHAAGSAVDGRRFRLHHGRLAAGFRPRRGKYRFFQLR